MYDCETMQLLHRYSLAGADGDAYRCLAALPAGRLAAGNKAGIDVLDLESAGCGAETVLSTIDAAEGCAACLGKAGLGMPYRVRHAQGAGIAVVSRSR